jgi:hypothetical protein
MFIWTQINAIFLPQAIIPSSQTIQPRQVKCRFWGFCAVARAQSTVKPLLKILQP